jgi:hypothetical protein
MGHPHECHTTTGFACAPLALLHAVQGEQGQATTAASHRQQQASVQQQPGSSSSGLQRRRPTCPEQMLSGGSRGQHRLLGW